ncbi:NAD(P)/FAD-dependent oxidoreductase [Albimonas pacifica]|uniref:Sarcosine oxidase n=1 Tax=Albimonas pacifica TaxID=1114924 RepID=A0A1I3BRU9_9RHOB|nr:FAD-binding oxidoreductase [Albimonas pacifica]SFH65017.1 sarcosine oxidase [Albimonas pacifica]
MSQPSAPPASSDVVIVGGGVVGAAISCWLKAFLGFPGSVTVIERDPSYARASTALSAAGLRRQFSTPVSIALSRYGAEVLRAAPTLFAIDDEPGPDLNFREDGYLMLAASPSQEAAIRANHAVQTAAGAETLLLTPDEIAARWPHLRTHDLTLGAFGPRGEGWFDNMGFLTAVSRRARAAGARFVTDEASGFEMQGGRVAAVTLASGARIACGSAVVAAGPRSGDAAAWAGLALPVGPRKRTIFVFDCATPPDPATRPPMMIDPSGVFCRPEGRFFLAGAPPVEDPEVALDDFDPRHEEFEEIVWPALAERSEVFEAIRLQRFWAGHYEWNAFDRNGVVGPHPDVANLVFATGFSGHGLQHAAGVGRGVAEWLLHGGYRSLDLAPLSWARLLENRPLVETEII